MGLNLLYDPKNCREMALSLHLSSKRNIFKDTNLEEVSHDHMFSIISPPGEEGSATWDSWDLFSSIARPESPLRRQMLGAAGLPPLLTASVMAPVLPLLVSRREARQLFGKLWGKKKINLVKNLNEGGDGESACVCLQVLACLQLADGTALAFFVSKLQNNHKNKNLSNVLMACLISPFPVYPSTRAAPEMFHCVTINKGVSSCGRGQKS